MAGPNLPTNRSTATSIADHVADHNAAHNVVNKIDKDATPVLGDVLKWNGSVYIPEPPASRSLTDFGLTDATTDIRPILDAAAAVTNDIVVPYRATAWPMTTTWTATGKTLRFTPGARISLNHATTRSMDLTGCTLIGASFTSTFTGPASAGDYGNYGFPAREIRLNTGCKVVGSYYQEFAATGIHIAGAHVSLCDTQFYRIRHRTGWAAAIHIESAAAFDIHGGHVYAEECDRAIEIEAGAHDVTFSGGGQLKAIYPNGYTGQPSNTSNADAAVYATYTSVIDGHTHSGEGGVKNLAFKGDWYLEDCGAAVTFSRATGSNDSDLPRNCHIDSIHMSGRTFAGASGTESIQIQGYNCGIDTLHMDLGGGVSASSRYRALFKDGTGAYINTLLAEAFDCAVVTVESTMSGARIGEARFLDGKVSGGGYLIDVAGPYTKIGRVQAFAVGNGSLAYVRFQATADNSELGTLNWTKKSGDTWVDPLVDLSQNTRWYPNASGPLVPSTIGRANKFLSIPQRAVGSNQLGNEVLRTCPFYLPWQITIDQIGCEIVTGGNASSVMRLGIYDDASGMPGNPIVDTTVAADAIATPMSTLGSPVTLGPGWYHSASVPQNAATTAPFVRSTTVAIDDFWVFVAATANTTFLGYSKTAVSGALPAFGTSIVNNNVATRLWVRVSV